jgi:hypothetical protein
MPSILVRACCALVATSSILSLQAACLAQVSFRLNDMQGDAERLEQTLQRRGSIVAVEMPLRDFADRLSQQFGVPIDLDTKKLEEAGVELDAPINKRLEAIPLEVILQHGLSDVELTFAIRNHVILITTPEEAESQLTTKIYPVRDLVFDRVSEGDYDSLIELITTTIAPQSWDEVGGPGSISGFDNAASLVISQTDEVHRAIEPLLVKLRQIKGLQGIPSEAVAPAASGKKSPNRRIAGRTASVAPTRTTGSAAQAWQLPQVYGSE